MDPVFKALADPTRRLLLDRLREHNGQTLGSCASAWTWRASRRRSTSTSSCGPTSSSSCGAGRERLHYLNPVPIHEIEERWISGFDKPRLQAISAIKNQAEEYAMTDEPTSVPTYVYVTYIRASAQQVWHALTDADLTARYWGHANVSDWQPGSTWEHRRVDGSGHVDVVGRVLEAEPPTRLVITFEDAPAPTPPRGPSVVTFLVEPHHDIVRLTVTHENLPNQAMLERDLVRVARRAREPQVAARDRRRPPAGAWEMPPAHA